MNVSLPEVMKQFVETQAVERGFGTSSEFVRDLIRHEQERSRLRALVEAGLASGAGSVMDAAYFDRLRNASTASDAPRP